MKSLLGLFLLANVAGVAAINTNMANNASIIFQNYAGSHNEGDLLALEQFRTKNGRLSFCTSFGNCWKKDGKMVEGELKVFTCEKWEEHAIPSFIRENEVIEIIRKNQGYYTILRADMLKAAWTFVQNKTNSRIDCDAFFTFASFGTEYLLSSVELNCAKCQFDDFLPSPLRLAMSDIHKDLQNYVSYTASNQRQRAVQDLWRFLERFYVSYDLTDKPHRYYEINVDCLNTPSNQKKRYTILGDEVPSNYSSEQIEKIEFALFLRKLVSIESAQKLNWFKFDDTFMWVEDQWILKQDNRAFDCKASAKFRTEIPDAPALQEFELVCNSCV